MNFIAIWCFPLLGWFLIGMLLPLLLLKATEITSYTICNFIDPHSPILCCCRLLYITAVSSIGIQALWKLETSSMNVLCSYLCILQFFTTISDTHVRVLWILEIRNQGCECTAIFYLAAHFQTSCDFSALYNFLNVLQFSCFPSVLNLDV